MAELSQIRRYDAEQNRERILKAARALFASDGLDVPLRQIARHAKVGPATLYRHFATKEILATAAFSDEMAACRTVVDASCAQPDPWRGLRQLVTSICDLHHRNRGFTAGFMAAYPAVDLDDERRYMLARIQDLLDRAHAAGQVREDFVLADLILMLTAHRGIRAGSPAELSRASRRYATLVLHAARADT